MASNFRELPLYHKKKTKRNQKKNNNKAIKSLQWLQAMRLKRFFAKHLKVQNGLRLITSIELTAFLCLQYFQF